MVLNLESVAPGAVGPVRLGNVTLPGWTVVAVRGGGVDTLVFPVSPEVGLPPGELAWLIGAIFRRVAPLRPGLALWVPVTGGGHWFRQALRDGLWGLPGPLAVTPAGVVPREVEFSFPPRRRTHIPPPPLAESPRLLEERTQRLLWALARLRQAHTVEVAAQAGLSPGPARTRLRALARQKLVEPTEADGYAAWRITRRGLQLALRAWWVPPGMNDWLPPERTTGQFRHRRLARLWPAWVRSRWPQHVQVWAGWSEARGVGGPLTPDGLAWGTLDGREALFWLEVESGQRSRARLRQLMTRRIAMVSRILARFHVVLTVLGPPRVAAALKSHLGQIPPNVALVLADWRRSGPLPPPRLGQVVVGENEKARRR